MTLILAMATRRWAVISGDCRLSWERRPIDDDTTKLAVVRLADARVALGFTGLAALGAPDLTLRGLPPDGAFRTVVWLVELVAAASQPDHMLLPTLDRLAAAMSKEWPPSAAPKLTHGSLLSVGFAGFRYEDGPGLPVLVSISNFVLVPGGYRVTRGFRVEQLDTPGLLALGVPRALTEVDIGVLQRAASLPTAAAQDVFVAVTRRAASSPRGAGVVGDLVQSVAIPAERAATALVRYHAPTASPYYALPHAVDARGEADDGIYLDTRYVGTEPGGSLRNITFPRPKRGQRCTCGSGLRWPACHGDKRRPDRSSETHVLVGPYRLKFGPADEPR